MAPCVRHLRGVGHFARQLASWYQRLTQLPALSMRRPRFADAQKKALLTAEQYQALALTLEALEALEDKRDRKDERVHSAVGLAAIRFIALTGFRRGECESLKWDEVDAKGHMHRPRRDEDWAVVAGLAIIEKQDPIADFAFPAGPEAEGYQ